MRKNGNILTVVKLKNLFFEAMLYPCFGFELTIQLCSIHPTEPSNMQNCLL